MTSTIMYPTCQLFKGHVSVRVGMRPRASSREGGVDRNEETVLKCHFIDDLLDSKYCNGGRSLFATAKGNNNNSARAGSATIASKRRHKERDNKMELSTRTLDIMVGHGNSKLYCFSDRRPITLNHDIVVSCWSSSVDTRELHHCLLLSHIHFLTYILLDIDNAYWPFESPPQSSYSNKDTPGHLPTIPSADLMKKHPHSWTSLLNPSQRARV